MIKLNINKPSLNNDSSFCSLLKEINFFTGLSIPTIRNTQSKSGKTLLPTCNIVFKRFNDSYQLAKTILDIAERISKSHTFFFLSDWDFAKKWYRVLVFEFSDDLMEASDSINCKKIKSSLLKRYS